MKKSQKLLIIFIMLYYILNIFNTYFVTTEVLNKYIVVFSRGFLPEVNSVLGNFAILSIFLFIGFLLIKKTNGRLIYLTVITFMLNIGIYASGIFTKYYQTVFSITETTLFKNPAADLAFSIFAEAFLELFLYFRIVVFVPSVVLFVLLFVIKRVYKNEELDFKEEMVLFNKRIVNGIYLAGSVIISVFSLSIYNISMNSDWPIFAERPLYGVQTAGLYNYYFGQVVGFKYEDSNVVNVDLRSYKEFNRNTNEYENLFGEKFSNILYKEDVELDFSLNSHYDLDNLNGIFKNKNLVLVHLESLNHFVLNEDGPYLDETYYETLKAILKESYYLENFYTNVGLGNSSDAEFSINTGIYSTGHTTLYWNYQETPYEVEALPKLFDDYYTVSLHGDVAEFYNRSEAHEDMLGFDDYIYFNPNETNYEGTKNGYHLFPEYVNTNLPNEAWLTDTDLLEWLKIVYNSKADKNIKGFYYPILLQPHTPYNYNPTKEEDLRFKEGDIDVSATTLRYLNYETYVEDILKEFINLTHELRNTVYIFYSDHGSGISQKDYETLLGITKGDKDKDNLKYRQEMIKTMAFIYVPDDNDTTNHLKRGLLKGVQPRVRSQVDIYRTVVELFGLETDSYYFGVNALSKEHTFSIDTRTFSIVTDDYYLIGKKMTKEEQIEKAVLFLTENPTLTPLEVYNYVFKFKYKMDRALTENAYQYFKNEN